MFVYRVYQHIKRHLSKLLLELTGMDGEAVVYSLKGKENMIELLDMKYYKYFLFYEEK